MVGPLEALVGERPAADAVAAALSTIPAAELPGALRVLARTHGPAAVPLLARCLDQSLAGRPDRAIAAAEALGTIAAPAAAEALAGLERAQPPKAVRTAARRGLYRLRQAGVVPAAPPAPPPMMGRRRPEPRQAWASAIDGTGSRGCWLLRGGRTRRAHAPLRGDQRHDGLPRRGQRADRPEATGRAPRGAPGRESPALGRGAGRLGAPPARRGAPPSRGGRDRAAGRPRPVAGAPRRRPGGHAADLRRRDGRGRGRRDHTCSTTRRRCSPCRSWPAGSSIPRRSRARRSSSCKRGRAGWS